MHMSWSRKTGLMKNRVSSQSVLEEMLDPDLGMAAGFKKLVDLGDKYQEKVAYPVYLELIKQRLANGVYRRKEALMFDIEHLASTVEGCGGFTNDGVRARIVQNVLLETIRDQSIVELSPELMKKHEVAHDVKQVKVEQQGTKMSWSKTKSPPANPSVCSSSSSRPKVPGQGPPRKMAQPGLRTFGCFH
ncbi:hypothetical protein RvY_10476 [Ramazzottius varieornatus]|uniref:Bromo domain-containing protein n=1 Tax=Ramazzottius varieornatus TaxID=947166 RepID=A0A1D1VI86_RAMVA|nr:hypothetical protein RvY_10476 [Ramazzottius varieornatus]